MISCEQLSTLANEDLVIKHTSKQVKTVIIWLHGLGANNHYFLSIIKPLELPPELGISFIFPNAPNRPVTINNGYVMRAWYDITDRVGERNDKEGITASEKILISLVQQCETLGISSENIILAGFSQGSAIALYTGIQYKKKLKGIISLSGYLPLRDHIEPSEHKCPIFQAHGSADEIVISQHAENTKNWLKSKKHLLSYHQYEMAHEICWQEIKDLSKWLINT